MDENRIVLLGLIKEIVNELVDSSSSSSEDAIEALVFGRNSRPKVKRFLEDVVNSYSDVEFKKNFRISRDLTEYLVAKYTASTWYKARNYKGGRPQMPAESHMLAFLWFAANKTTFREVAKLFDMTLSSMYNTFNKVLNFLAKDIAPETIRFPNEIREKEVIAKSFENIAGFPNVLGCINRSFITSRKPKHKIRSTYTNRNDSVSITLQGICDAKLRFLDVFTGVPGKIHDARVLRLSSIGKELSSACAPSYYLLGESGYPLREYLLTPYRNYGNLTEAEKCYNMKFHQTRVKIENAFGILKSRFRQLMRLDFHNVQSMAKFVIACCALHNLCIERDDDLGFSIIGDDNEINSTERGDRREQPLSELGQIKRNDVKNQLYIQRNID